MSEITIRSDFDVDYIQHIGDDAMICKAARVSTLGVESIDSEESAGLIKFLMNNRHGSPFEHNSMTFRITAPIMVWREFMRHRIGFSYNEQSGRYMELDGSFYIPETNRPLVQIGKTGAYELIQGDERKQKATYTFLYESYYVAWDMYQRLLSEGVAKEVARLCLPVATYSTAYVTCNARSCMAFLSLRTKVEDSMFPSYPQWEINQVANQIEVFFKELFPITSAAFDNARRVAP